MATRKKRKRYREEQIVRILREAEVSGVPIAQFVKKHGVTETTFHRWKKRYGGPEVSDAKWLKELESENRRLKKMVAGLHLDIDRGSTERKPLTVTSNSFASRLKKIRTLGHRTALLAVNGLDESPRTSLLTAGLRKPIARTRGLLGVLCASPGGGGRANWDDLQRTILNITRGDRCRRDFSIDRRFHAQRCV